MIGFERIITILDRKFVVRLDLKGWLQYLIEYSLYVWIWKDNYNIWQNIHCMNEFEWRVTIIDRKFFVLDLKGWLQYIFDGKFVVWLDLKGWLQYLIQIFINQKIWKDLIGFRTVGEISSDPPFVDWGSRLTTRT